MKLSKSLCLTLAVCLFAMSACQTGAAPASSSNLQPTSASSAAQTVRACDFVPGKSVAPQIPPGSSQPANPTAPPAAFTISKVDSQTLAKQMNLYYQIDADIINHYAYANFKGQDWTSISLKYKDLVRKGLSQADFYLAMKQMVGELDDEQSYFLDPSEQTSQTAATPSNPFGGIGSSFYTINDSGQTTYVLSWVFPGSPADKAGLKSHDILLKVDGGPFMDASGSPRTTGPAGSSVTVTVRTPGQTARDVKMVRSKISPTTLVDDCLVTGTGIGYIRWIDLTDPAVLNQTIDALNQMSGSSSLKGLIIDKRMVGSADDTILQSLLSLFVGGELGSFVSPRDVNKPTPVPFTANPVTDVSGSLNVPLVVIQDQTTGDAGLFSGLLQLLGRARIVGLPTNANASIQFVDNFSDGSALYVNNLIFQPRGKAPGYLDKTGVTPDAIVSGRWDQYNEANDPYLAKAIELLMQK
jgi:carboxyl-terminal processing protease